MIKINLLSEGKRVTAVRKSKATSLLQGQDIGQWLLAAGLILGALAVGAYWWKLKGDVEAQQEEISAANREVEALAAVIKEVEDYKGKKAELERKIKIINDLKLNQRGPVRVMDHISRALPELLWLDRMTMNASTIEIEGRAFNTNAVANFIENLDKVPEFEEPTLKDTAEQGGGVYKFVIDFNYSFAPLAQDDGKGGAAGLVVDAGSGSRADLRVGGNPVAVKTGLEGKPWYVGAGVGIGLGIVVFGLGWWQILSPQKDQLEAGERQLAEFQTKIQEGRAAKQQLPKFRDEVHQLEVELDKLLRILPARRNTPDLLRRIRALAEQGDFSLKRFTPGNLSDKEFFSEWPIAISVDGTYHNLALFFDRISRFSRIINVEDLNISALPTGQHTITASFNAKTFVYKEPTPGAPPGGAPAAAPAGGGGEAPLGPAARARANRGGGGGDGL